MTQSTQAIPTLREQVDTPWVVEYGGATRRGPHHDCNQDYSTIGASGLSFALFDGMGGPPYGDIASRVGANVVVDAYESGLTLRAAMAEAANAVAALGKWLRSEETGCTALAVVVEGGQLRVAWLGDTIAVLVRNGEAKVLTEPDKPPIGNGVTRCFGAGMPQNPHELSVRIQEEDIVLLCTDGVWSVAETPVLASVASIPGKGSPEIAYSLVYDIAKGSQDDASVLVLRINRGCDPAEVLLCENESKVGTNEFLEDGQQ